MFARIAVAATVLTFACACAVQGEPAMPPPLQASAIEASCTTIMGLQKGEFRYLACRDSLGASAAGMAESQARLQAYDACHSRGMAAGALATCMLDSEHAAPVQVASVVAAPSPVALPHDDLGAGRSYYGVTHAVQWRREQYSCAQLGLLPGSGAFTHCVASLDADLQSDLP